MLDELRKAAPAAFYKPNVAAPESLIKRFGGNLGVSRSQGDAPFFVSDKKIRVSSGGNRSGKTTKCVLEAGANCVGFRPWFAPDDPRATDGLVSGHRLGRVRGICVVANFEVKIPDIMIEFEKWWPTDWWRISKGGRTDPREIEWFNGATIRLLSHKVQDHGDVEGIEADFLWFDEPPPEWMWIALLRGLVSTGGKAFVGATLLNKSAWFWESMIAPGESGARPDVDVFWHSIWDNCSANGGLETQTPENIRMFLDSIMDPDERLAREHGHPMHVGGLVLSHFRFQTSVIHPFDIPHDAVLYAGIDPGGAKPMAAAWLAVFDRGDGMEIHLIDESWDLRTRNDLGLFAEDFKVKDKGLGGVFHPSGAVYTVIDPLANQPQKGDKWGRTMVQILDEEYKIVTIEADKQNKRARLGMLNAFLKSGKLKVWSNCKRAIMEAGKWSWKQDSPKLTIGSDDVWDCVSYILALDVLKQTVGISDETHPDVYEDPFYRDEKRRKDNIRSKYREEWRRRKALRSTVMDKVREER